MDNKHFVCRLGRNRVQMVKITKRNFFANLLFYKGKDAGILQNYYQGKCSSSSDKSLRLESNLDNVAQPKDIANMLLL